MICPCGCEDSPVEFGAVLKIVAHRQLGVCVAVLSEVVGKERCDKAWKHKFSFNIILLVVFCLVAFQTGYCLERGAQLYAEQFAAAEKVTVLICQ